jgi:predicted ferric reductase
MIEETQARARMPNTTMRRPPAPQDTASGSTAKAVIEGVLMLLAFVVGAAATIATLPLWLPNLANSMLSVEPKAFWYLSRASAMVAYVLLWISMVMGLLMTNRLARTWPGVAQALDLHQHVGLLGLVFSLFHVLILLGDQYIGYTLQQLFTPFASTTYRPAAVALGQIGLYLMAPVMLSFYVRRWIGQRAWRALHFLSFVLFMLALAHGLLSGSDSGAAWVQNLYWISGGSVLFLTIYRVLVAGQQPAETRRRPAASSR